MKKRRTIRFQILDLLWLIPAAIAAGARWLLQDRQALVEQIHSRTVFAVLSRPIAQLTSLAPFSITELLLVLVVFLLALGAFWLLIRVIRRLLNRSSRPLRLKPQRMIRVLAILISIGFLMFTLMHGLNYMREPVAESFNLPVRPRTTAELANVTASLARAASKAREACQEDAQGIFRLRDGIRGTLDQTAAGYAAAAGDWPLLTGPQIRPKGVLLSHYWSYTGITGLYFPFLIEANVNIDQPAYTIPDTAGHELAHTRGFAREDEAGFISFLAGIHHPNPDFRYSVLANAYVRSANALYDQSPDAYQVVAALVSDGMSRDLADNSRYWQQFAGPVAEVSEQINNTYLKANNQTDGVRSYGRMIDLVLAYYERTDGRI